MIHDLRIASAANDDVIAFHVRDHATDVILFTHFDDDDADDVRTYAVLALDPRDTDDALSIYYADVATTNSDPYDPNDVPDAVRRLADRIFAI